MIFLGQSFIAKWYFLTEFYYDMIFLLAKFYYKMIFLGQSFITPWLFMTEFYYDMIIYDIFLLRYDLFNRVLFKYDLSW